MVWRRPATLAAAVLVLALSGCGSAHAGAAPVHRAAAAPSGPAAQADDGATQPEPAPSPSDPPSPSSPGRAAKPAGPQVPTGSGSPSPGTSGGTGSGHGPFGSLTGTGSSGLALTFDDGPSGYTNQVLDLLAQYHVKATFCLIGQQVAAYAEQVRRIVAEGHTLCNHTWTHDLNLRNRPTEQIRSELQRTTDAIHAIVPDAPIRYFREPGGNWGPSTVNMATSLGMTCLHWNADPQDWRRPGAQAIINYVLRTASPGGIILMHDGGGDRSGTVLALRTILPNLVSRFTLIPMPVS